MKSINNYILEKLHIKKGMQSKADYEDVIDDLTDEISKNINLTNKDDIDDLRKTLKFAKFNANTTNKDVALISLKDYHKTAWLRWKDHYKINGVDDGGNKIIAKIEPGI